MAPDESNFDCSGRSRPTESLAHPARSSCPNGTIPVLSQDPSVPLDRASETRSSRSRSPVETGQRKSPKSEGSANDPSQTASARATRRRRIVEQKDLGGGGAERPRGRRGASPGSGRRHGDRVAPVDRVDSYSSISTRGSTDDAERRRERRSRSRGDKRRSKSGGRRSKDRTMVGKGGEADPRRSPRKPLTVDTDAANAEADSRKKGTATPKTEPNTPASARRTPTGLRGNKDIRSVGGAKTPVPVDTAAGAGGGAIPDFITQTDQYGRAVTPRSSDAINSARQGHSSGRKSNIHVENGKVVDDDGNVLRNQGDDDSDSPKDGEDGMEVDACDSLLESLRIMCCCLLPEDSQGSKAGMAPKTPDSKGISSDATTATVNTGGTASDKSNYSSQQQDTPGLVEEPSDDTDRVRLLPKHHPDDVGKKCLVLDLDETLVHSSFRAVPGADFVIPVQIEDVVHFVYVMKRPGVDEFLIEMAKHYEVVIYTASLNKYADPLLDLLDPHRTIRFRLFRESCVYYEGNYVKDLSLLDRDLTQSIIVDNSPSSYMFHPENAIDCSSFIDDPNDRELDQIGAFLAGIKDVHDVRGVSNLWRDWPNIPHVPGLPEDYDQEDER